MTDKIETTYDDIPYIGKTFCFTHPDALATAARLMGLDSPSPDQCRVLELGCGDGRNLIPMAESLPDSTFVGIDLGRTHIESGQQFIQELGLQNIELRQMDIADVDPDFGQFDYIICHGVYSWIPSTVQERILDVCRQHLTSHGVAFISYNTFPGWHMRRMIRDMTAFHVDAAAEPVQRVQQARELLTVLLNGMAGQNDAYSHLLKSEMQRALHAEQHYFFHEHLEEFNQPLYHHEFVRRAADHQMQYLCDAEIRLMLPVLAAPEFEQLLQTLARDRTGRSQYSDFLTNRAFRKTLLCRDGLPVHTQPVAGQLPPFYVRSLARPVSPQCSIHDGSEIAFKVADGSGISVSQPLVKAAFLHLSEIAPASVTVEELLKQSRKLLHLPPSTPHERHLDTEMLGTWLLSGHATSPTSAIEFSCVPSRFVAAVSEFPVTTSLVRLQVNKKISVASRKHQSEAVDAVHAHVLAMLDGTNDLASVTTAVSELRRQQEIALPEGVADDAELAAGCLRNLARAGLLIA